MDKHCWFPKARFPGVFEGSPQTPERILVVAWSSLLAPDIHLSWNKPTRHRRIFNVGQHITRKCPQKQCSPGQSSPLHTPMHGTPMLVDCGAAWDIKIASDSIL